MVIGVREHHAAGGILDGAYAVESVGAARKGVIESVIAAGIGGRAETPAGFQRFAPDRERARQYRGVFVVLLRSGHRVVTSQIAVFCRDIIADIQLIDPDVRIDSAAGGVLVDRAEPAVVFIGIGQNAGGECFEVAGAGDPVRLVACAFQRGQQHAGQNRDDRYMTTLENE